MNLTGCFFLVAALFLAACGQKPQQGEHVGTWNATIESTSATIVLVRSSQPDNEWPDSMKVTLGSKTYPYVGRLSKEGFVGSPSGKAPDTISGAGTIVVFEGDNLDAEYLMGIGIPVGTRFAPGPAMPGH